MSLYVINVKCIFVNISYNGCSNHDRLQPRSLRNPSLQQRQQPADSAPCKESHTKRLADFWRAQLVDVAPNSMTFSVESMRVHSERVEKVADKKRLSCPCSLASDPSAPHSMERANYDRLSLHFRLYELPGRRSSQLSFSPLFFKALHIPCTHARGRIHAKIAIATAPTGGGRRALKP